MLDLYQTLTSGAYVFDFIYLFIYVKLVFIPLATCLSLYFFFPFGLDSYGFEFRFIEFTFFLECVFLFLMAFFTLLFNCAYFLRSPFDSDSHLLQVLHLTLLTAPLISLLTHSPI